MTKDKEALIEAIIDDVRVELHEAYKNFPDFRSAHEGVAVVDEEMREFRAAAYWPHKHDDPEWAEQNEATQLAAMAIRYLVDICANEEAPR